VGRNRRGRAEPAGVAALEQRTGGHGTTFVVRHEAVPAGPADDRGREVGDRRWEAVALRERRSEVRGRLGVGDPELGPRLDGLEPARELLPRIVRDEASRPKLVVEARGGIEGDPERGAGVERNERVQVDEVVEPHDPVQLARRKGVAANCERAAVLRGRDGAVRLCGDPVAERFEFGSLARLHPWDARASQRTRGRVG
jgi:hypothetical protein